MEFVVVVAVVVVAVVVSCIVGSWDVNMDCSEIL